MGGEGAYRRVASDVLNGQGPGPKGCLGGLPLSVGKRGEES